MDHSEFLKQVNDGYKDADHIEDYLNQFVLDREQRNFLHKNNLNVRHILTGKYPVDISMEVSGWMISVNKNIGGKLFRW